jgi:Ca2+-binding EF-hand superfamily protein
MTKTPYLIALAILSALSLTACGKSKEERVSDTFNCIQKNKGSTAKYEDVVRTCAKENGANDEEMRSATSREMTSTPDWKKFNWPSK